MSADQRSFSKFVAIFSGCNSVYYVLIRNGLSNKTEFGNDVYFNLITCYIIHFPSRILKEILRVLNKSPIGKSDRIWAHLARPAGRVGGIWGH